MKMKVDKRLESIIKNHWNQMVNNAYFYRGMSLNNLNLKSTIALDSNNNPIKEMIPLMMEYSEFLLHLIKKGLEFHVNDFYVEPLQKILNWTIRDIKNPGIDFTTNYADAASYAFNYAGSQVKHNFKLITDAIHQCEDQSCFSKDEKMKFQELTKQIKKIISADETIDHRHIVVKVKRSCQSFQDESLEELNIGSYAYFFDRIKKQAIEKDSFNIERIAFFLHQISQSCAFNIRLIKPLHKKDIVDIIKLC